MIARKTNGRPITIWSAGCSSGEEPYTLAMVLSEYASTNPGFRFKLLATDICNTVLSKAKTAVYTSDVIEPVSLPLRRKYLMRGRDKHSDQWRIVPELRSLIEFRRLNFMDSTYGLEEKVDAIFCRNVIIYFDRPTQQAILRKLAANLVDDGFAFLGHSETLHSLDVPFTPIAPALYRKTNGTD